MAKKYGKDAVADKVPASRDKTTRVSQKWQIRKSTQDKLAPTEKQEKGSMANGKEKNRTKHQEKNQLGTEMNPFSMARYIYCIVTSKLVKIWKIAQNFDRRQI